MCLLEGLPHLKSMEWLGYRHVVQLLGDWDCGTAVRELQADTRRYAKRQLPAWVPGRSPGNDLGFMRRTREGIADQRK